jgi:hypothetical protein
MQDLGFDEQFAERRMSGVGGRRCENDFRVARDIKRPSYERTVGDADPAQLNIVFRRNGDFGERLDIVITATKRCTPNREDHFGGVCAPERWLICS